MADEVAAPYRPPELIQPQWRALTSGISRDVTLSASTPVDAL